MTADREAVIAAVVIPVHKVQFQIEGTVRLKLWSATMLLDTSAITLPSFGRISWLSVKIFCEFDLPVPQAFFL
jgi:hypothetical protein